MTTPLAYTVGPDDVIAGVNDRWVEFAMENDGQDLLAGAVVGRRIWDFIVDETTRGIYHQLFDRVRGGSAPVRFAFRCDAPAVLRLLEMRISRGPGGCLALETQVLVATPREPVPLLEPHREATGAMIRMCAWCQRIADAHGHWLEIEAALVTMRLFEGGALPRISHGMCDECSRTMMAALDTPTHAPWQGVVLGGAPAAPQTALDAASPHDQGAGFDSR